MQTGTLGTPLPANGILTVVETTYTVSDQRLIPVIHSEEILTQDEAVRLINGEML